MDIKTLEALGVIPADLAERVVEQAVNALLESVGYDSEGEEFSQASKFKKQINQRVQEAVDRKVDAMFAQYVLPRVGEIIEAADMRKTSAYGEPKGEPMTFKEYIANRAETYMSEKVDYNGVSKSDSRDSYQWREYGPRLAVLMQLYIRDTMDKAAKSAVTNVNKEIAKNIEQAAKDAIAKCAENISITVKA